MAWIPAVASFAGDIIGANAQSNAQASANTTNIQLQREQQMWEEKMSNTAQQRQAADLEKAGINKIYGYSKGMAASTPNVAPAHVESTGGGAAGALGHATTSAMNLYMQTQQATQMKLQNAKIAAETTATAAQAELTRSQIPELSSRIKQQGAAAAASTASAAEANQRVSNLQLEMKKIDEELKNIRAEARGKTLSNQLAMRVMDMKVRREQAEATLAAHNAATAGAKADVATTAQSGLDAIKNTTGNITERATQWLYEKTHPTVLPTITRKTKNRTGQW